MSAFHLKVLLVDDFSMVRASIRSILRDLGITDVTEAKDGLQALEILKESRKTEEPFNLIFCDWNMPQMTGLELLKEIKREKDLGEIPFVMVTAERDQSSVVEALREGARDYIVKPFNKSQISRKLDRVLQVRVAA